MTTSPAAEQHDALPGTYQYTEEIVDLLLHDRDMLTEVALRIAADVESRVQRQGLLAADAFALAEAEARHAWPALVDAVTIMVRLSSAGMLRSVGDEYGK